jgi:predicted aminopeptidase
MRRRLLSCALAAALASGCAGPYVLRAAYEEARILLRREPIVSILAQPDLDPTTRAKLVLVLDARRFARERLGFAVGESYATVARVDGDAVAWVVTAAYRDRLEPYTWRFPIVGRVPYRGFFARPRAHGYAASLEKRGLDTAVWPTTAFSTLGWFADPVLSTMLAGDPVELVTVIFHELTHARLYVPHHAPFNESFANFVGHRAAIAFLCGEAIPAVTPPAACETARERWEEELARGAVLAEIATRLGALYATGHAAADLARQRAEILSAAPASLVRANNAVLLQHLLYRRDLDRFEAVVAAEGGALRDAVDRVADAVADAPDPFAALARRLSE